MIVYDYNIHKEYNGKALHGDIVELDDEKKEITKIVKRATHKVVGVLLLDSKRKYGVYKEKLLYLFKPCVPNYPDFYVTSKYENLNEKKYVYIEFAEWNNYLRGNIIDYIGTVGTKEGEYNYLKYINGLNGIKDLKIDKKKIENDKVYNEEFQKKCKSKENNNHYYQLFSIDPVGCKDIDDAFHFKVLNEEEELYEIGVHIAYTWSYFKEDIEKYFKLFSERVSTFYGYNKNVDMIPKEYSENISSLIEKSYKNVLSIVFKIKNNMIINYEIGLNVGYIYKNYDYESVNKINKNKNDLSKRECMLMEFMEISKNIFKTHIVEDSHKLVEYWMVYANSIMANECVKRYKDKCILRVQEVKKNVNKKENIDIELQNFLKIYCGESALYQRYDIENDEINYHQNIVEFIKEKDYYTHYTSPIRRFCDMYIHGLITNLYSDEMLHNIDYEYMINHMNKINKNMRKYQNQSKIIDLLFKYVDKDEYIINSSGYIMEINVEKNGMKVYFPEFGFILKRELVNRKFKSIVEISETNNVYSIKIDEEEYVYEVYKKYELKIYLFPKKYVLNERMIFIF